MKLNLGCGYRKIDGFINIDKDPDYHPDLLMDIGTTPWDFASNEVEEVLFLHSLEKIGRTNDDFFGVMKELYRVCKPDAKITIHTPHPRHDNFIGDLRNIRIISPVIMEAFSKENNRKWQERGWVYPQLAVKLDVDFEIIKFDLTLEQKYLELYKSNQLSQSDLNELVNERNNIVSECQIFLKVIK